MHYLDLVDNIILEHPNRAAFVADGSEVTFAEVDVQAQRMYRYLTNAGIGREDIVQILMPKKLRFYSCMLGVWRAGAAFVLTQDDYPKERIEFIRKDTHACLVLDDKLFEEIMSTCEPKEGRADADPHDLAYVVFTSGSTGTPKGIMHERGNVDRCIAAVPPRSKVPVPETRPLTGPLSFVQTILNVLYNTMGGVTTLLEEQDVLRDFEEYKRFIEESKITTVYLPPSLIRIYKDPSPYLRVIGTGSEPANGLFYPGGKPAIMNTYSMSEAGFAIMSTILDKAYDVAPIGKPLPGIEACLIADDGTVVEGPGTGELCFNNDYFRGYLNQPELTAEVKQGGVFHTKDICRRDERGVYFVVGRADDMVKINGNRIEPAEIEAAVREFLGLSKVVAKGFVEPNRSFVVAYYLLDEARELGILTKEGELACNMESLANMLPSYMIPTYYVGVEEFPLSASGKILRSALVAPVIDLDSRPYVAPRNERERYVVQKMAEVLGVEQVGVTDDFFKIGGDSLRAIALVSACDELEISAKLVYQLRTAEQIATKCPTRLSLAEQSARDRQALEGDLELLPGQLENLYYQSYAPQSGFLNLTYFWEMQDGVDAKRLARAMSHAIAAHPALCTRIFRAADGLWHQRFDASFLQEVEVTQCSDAEFDDLVAKTRAVLPVEDSKLYRANVYVTETATYLALSVHHIISDGSAMPLLAKDILGLYANDDYMPESDHYFAVVHSILKDEDEAKSRVRDYFATRLNARRASGVPLGLIKDRENSMREGDILRIEETFERTPWRDSNFYLCAAALAEAWYNKCDAAFISTIYGCRDEADRMSAFGLLVNSLALCLDVREDATPQELLLSVKEQMDMALSCPEYSWIKENVGDGSDIIRFIYQKDIYSRDGKQNALIKKAHALSDRSQMPGSVSLSVIDNTGEDRLRIALRYSASNYDKANVERYADLIVKAIHYLDGVADKASA